MHAVFWINESVKVQWSNIISIDLSMYDEIMLSTMSTPVFKLSFFLHYFKGDTSDPANSFKYWWNEMCSLDHKSLNNIRVQLFDSTGGNPIADGCIYEYVNDFASGKVVITCNSGVSVYLDEEVKVSDDNLIDKIGKYSGFIVYEKLLSVFIENVWKKGFVGKKKEISEKIITDTAKLIHNITHTDWGGTVSGLYIFRLEYKFQGKRYDLLKNLSQIFNAKIIYNVQEDKFMITPFQMYHDNPTILVSNTNHINSGADGCGYVKSEEWQESEQGKIDNICITGFKRLNIKSKVMENYTDRLKSAINNRMMSKIYFRSFEIWGYANKVLYSGQTIRIDNENYYIKDIKY